MAEQPIHEGPSAHLHMRRVLEGQELIDLDHMRVVAVWYVRVLYPTPSLSSADNSPFTPLFHSVALLGVFGVAGALISMRKIGTRAHLIHNVNYFSAWCLIVSVASMSILKIPWVMPPNPIVWLLEVCALGILGFSGQVTLNMGFRLEAAGRGSLALYVQVSLLTRLPHVCVHNR